jgi:hypothetical protein
MPKYLVEALSQYRMVYVVEADCVEHAEDSVHLGDATEFGQMHLGEMVVSSRQVTDEECIRVHDELNDYLKEWTPEQKLSRVYKVD